MNVPIPLPRPTTPEGKRVRLSFVFAVITGAVGLLTLADQLGWRTPKAALAEVSQGHVILHNEIIASETSLRKAIDSGVAERIYVKALLESMAKDLCLHRTPTQRVTLGLPCHTLLKDALPSIGVEPEAAP